MRQTIHIALALAAGLVVSAGAQTRPFAQGTKVVVVGPITSQPRDAGVAVESKMQVGIGPDKRDYTLHIGDSKMYGYHGNEIAKSALKDKMWVRAEGEVMDDPRRIKVTRLQVIGADAPSVKSSAFYRPGFDTGYVMAVAGARESYPETRGALFQAAPMTIVGRVSDDTGAFESTRKIQVDAAGNTWTFHVNKDAPVVDAKGEKISVHEIKKGQWVRASGWQMDDLRLRAARLENLGPQEAFQASRSFRQEYPLGYVERITITPAAPVSLRGSIVSVHPDGGFFIVKDQAGKEHVVYSELAEVREGTTLVPFGNLRSGQTVVITVREYRFQ